MREIFRSKKKLVISIAICTMFVAIVIPSITARDPAIDRGQDYDWEIIGDNVVTGNRLPYPMGNVGIGTLFPDSKLDIHGDLRITNPSDNNDFLAISSSGSSASLMFMQDGAHIGQSIILSSNGDLSAESLTSWFGLIAETGDVIVKMGEVGIRTTSPENALHVNGAINLDPITAPGNPTTGFVLYCDSSDGKLKAKSSAGSVTVLATP